MSAAATNPMPASPEPLRLHALDGLRGAAAVAVVAFHVVSFVNVPSGFEAIWMATPFGALVNGPAAVHVFFVLSGCVLALSLSRDGGAGGVARFYVRRVFRIQPPYMVAVLFAFLAAEAVVPAGGAARAAQLGVPWVRLPVSLLPVALAFPSMAFGLLPVGWSLFVEMAMSALLPLILWIARRSHALVPIGVALLLLQPIERRIAFLIFTIDFALGVALFVERARMARWFAGLPAWFAIAWMAFGLELLQLPQLLGWQTARWNQLAQGATPRPLLAMAIGSAVLVAGALHLSGVRRWFEAPIARFYGRVSYSLYLVHLTVLLVPLSALRLADSGIAWPLALPAFAAVLAISTALAALGHRFVEAPAIAAGRAVVRAGEAFARRARA